MRLRAASFDEPRGDGDSFVKVIAEYAPVELVDRRDGHTRVYEIVREVETTHPDGSRTVETVKSYIFEKASGLCYRDESGNFVAAVAEWRETPEGFVIDRCAYGLSIGRTIGSGLEYAVDGHELTLRPAYLVISDDLGQARLGEVDPTSEGFIVPGSPSVARFPGAFGPGYDLEYVAEKGGFHQNLVIRECPDLPAEFHADTSRVSLYTEINLDEYLAASGYEVAVEGEPVDTSAADFVSPLSRGGCISFRRPAGTAEEGRDMVHAFSVSRVADSPPAGVLVAETIAQKGLLKDPSTGAAYLVESLPFSYFLDGPPSYPVIWDFQQKNSPITGDETWEPRFTYWVSSEVSVSGALTILPGTTVKLDGGETIGIVTDGEILARGDPYNYITFTNAEDDNCGEPIPGAQPGNGEIAMDIASDSSASSVIQYSKVGHADTGIWVRQSLGAPIAHNIVRFCDTHGIRLESCQVACHNNLITDTEFGVACLYLSSSDVTSNTVDNCSAGIFTFGATVDIYDCLITSSSWGVYCYGGSAYVDYCAFWDCGTDIYGGSQGDNNKHVSGAEDPYEVSAIGNHFLDPGNPEVTEYLIDGGHCLVEDAELADEVFTVYAPEAVASGVHYGVESWSKIETDVDLVDIGYHHNRVDRVVPGSTGFSGGGASLTIQPGVVVAIEGEFPERFWFYNGPELTCVGDPGTEGYNLITDSEPVSMNIESRDYDSWESPYILIYPQAGDEIKIQFTKFSWLTYGVYTFRTIPDPLKDNVFTLCGFAVISEGCPNALKNNLFYRNWAGIYASGSDCDSCNNTFDTNDVGIYYERSAGHTLKVVDSLFTDFTAGDISPPAEKEGISLYGPQQGTFLHNFNAFYGLTYNVYDDELGSQVPIGTNSLDLEESPYHGKEEGCEACWFLRQTPDGPSDMIPVDSGSRSARYARLSDYTTSVSAEKDVRDVDIGYHHSHGDFVDTDGDGMPDVWEEKWGFDPEDPSDATADGDNDELSSLEEYFNGTYPDDPNSDDDDLDDGKEVMRGGGAMDRNFPRGPYLHLVWEDQQPKMVVRWRTGTARIGAIRYRKEAEAWSDPVVGSSTTEHEVKTEALDPNALYSYEVGWMKKGTTYEREYGTRHFWSPPTGTADFEFVVYGDNRGDNEEDFREEHARVVAGVLQKTLDARFIVHVGDLVYRGVGLEGKDHWNPHFFWPAQPLLEIAPLFPCLGNHEYDGDPNGERYKEYFTLPQEYQPEDPKNERWYHFDYADWRLICLDTNKVWDFDDQGDPQRQWLTTKLSEASQQGKRILVWFHHPPFCSGEEHGQKSDDNGRDVREHLVPDFQDYAAEMVFSGHDHLYERAACTYLGNTVRYIVTGGGGAPLHNGLLNYTYPPPPTPPAGQSAVQEALYAKNYHPGQDDNITFQFCVVPITASSYQLLMYNWAGILKDQWP